ncbi:MAG: DcaP family trimeric outer membrane transporter [Clostridium sp.]|nr:DcaP family trimeric outer membrane transporter [Clostridium sp.]
MLASVLGANAQTSYVEEAHKKDLESHKYVYFGDGRADSIEHARLIEQFYTDQFRHAQDPQAPYFLLMSRDSKIAMGVGGNITAIGAYDWHGMIDGDGFSPYSISIPADHARPNAFQTSIGNSSLFLTVFGNHDKIGTFKFYIQAKFAGGGDDHYFKLKNAYATAGDWTLGYTLSTFTDPGAQPSTVETTGPNSEMINRRVLVRYMHSFRNGLTIALSAENPDNTYVTNAYTEAGNVYMPDFSGFVQYGWGHNEHIRLSGIVKGIRYRDLVEQRNRYATGWGVSLTTVFRPCRQLTVFGSGYTGQGIGNQINDLSLGSNDLVAMSTEPGKMKATLSYGWYAALQYNFSHRLFSTLIVSQERILPKSGMAYSGDDYKYGLYGAANLFYNITSRWQIGAEFNIGKRSNINGSHRMAYRACCLAQFNF